MTAFATGPGIPTTVLEARLRAATETENQRLASLLGGMRDLFAAERPKAMTTETPARAQIAFPVLSDEAIAVAEEAGLRFHVIDGNFMRTLVEGSVAEGVSAVELLGAVASAVRWRAEQYRLMWASAEHPG